MNAVKAAWSWSSVVDELCAVIPEHNINLSTCPNASVLGQVDRSFPALEVLSEDARESLEERAAIMEFDGGLSRENAEEMAYKEILNNKSL